MVGGKICSWKGYNIEHLALQTFSLLKTKAATGSKSTADVCSILFFCFCYRLSNQKKPTQIEVSQQNGKESECLPFTINSTGFLQTGERNIHVSNCWIWWSHTAKQHITSSGFIKRYKSGTNHLRTNSDTYQPISECWVDKMTPNFIICCLSERGNCCSSASFFINNIDHIKCNSTSAVSFPLNCFWPSPLNDLMHCFSKWGCTPRRGGVARWNKWGVVLHC